MSWLPWRRKEIEQARQAKRDVEKRRREVDPTAEWVLARGRRNNLGPLFQKALKGG